MNSTTDNFEPIPVALQTALREAADETDRLSRWPAEQLRLCADAGLIAWFAPRQFGGREIPASDMLRGLAQLASACLTTAFCLTQPGGVVSRVAACDNEELKQSLIPELMAGRAFGAVGIAQLTTSRRHVQPVMRARETREGFVLDGVIPWVTGGAHAKWIVTGATLDDGRQLLGVLPTELPGVVVGPAAEMVGLSATSTGPVRCDGVLLERRWLLAPVVVDVLKHGRGAQTGGLQTSALALGSATAAIRFLAEEADRRADLRPIAAGFDEQRLLLETDLLATAQGGGATNADELRRRANDLALRSAQAALAAAKGSGYVVGHPAGRWCREALFYLVWSCPQPVAAATLCDLAKIGL